MADAIEYGEEMCVAANIGQRMYTRQKRWHDYPLASISNAQSSPVMPSRSMP